MRTAFLTLFVICSLPALAQEVNRVDDNGRKQGPWKKSYPNTDQLRYEGQFENDREVGIFKFYCKDCGSQPVAVKEFKDDGTAQVTFYDKKGNKLSEGSMLQKDRIGAWKIYDPKLGVLVAQETYTNNGKLDGIKQTYYPNGQLTEELTYQEGVLQGPNNFYSEEGVLIKKLAYSNDELHGPAEYYDASGNLTIKGQYVRGKKHGLWRYYKNGQVELEEIYPKPRPKRDN